MLCFIRNNEVLEHLCGYEGICMHRAAGLMIRRCIDVEL